MTSFAAYAKQDILIYSGPGAGPLSLTNTVATITQAVGTKYNIKTVGPEIIIDKQWLKNTALLIMPGGADRPYLEKLAGQGNANIRDYVASGGKYLGICAGAYYASDRLEFAKGDSELEVTGERKLKFFPGLISGPTYVGYDHRDVTVHAGARAANLSWQLDQPFAKNTQLTVFYNGGGSFIDAEKYDNVLILARYMPEIAGDTQQPAAIVECNYGKGKAILSGPHFEWDPAMLNTESAKFREIKPQLIAGNTDRIKLIKHLLARLDISSP